MTEVMRVIAHDWFSEWLLHHGWMNGMWCEDFKRSVWRHLKEKLND